MSALTLNAFVYKTTSIALFITGILFISSINTQYAMAFALLTSIQYLAKLMFLYEQEKTDGDLILKLEEMLKKEEEKNKDV
jgi:hypothetical protein